MSVVSLRPHGEMLLANLDAEHAVLGAALYANDTFEKLADLKAEYFYDPVHASIWSTLSELMRQRGEADILSVSAVMADHPGLQELGGLAFLADLTDRAYTPAARSHADIVVNCARLRHIIGIAEELRQSVTPGADAFSIIAEAERTLSKLVQDAAPVATNLIDARASAIATVDELDNEAHVGRAKGYMTGLRCFDRRLRGLRPGWLVVVAGRPSMGKTALARAAALGAAKKTSAQVVFFALEMARRELDERTLSQLSFEAGEGIAYTDMNGDKLDPGQRQWLRHLAGKVPANLVIDDSPILSVDYVRRRVLSLKQRGPVAAVFIDYLQIMERPDAKGRNEASVIGEMTKGLKQLAREAETCVVLLSQINRGVESRDDKRPQLSDLRESGAIEQDANAVLFPYREVYYLQRSPPKAESAQEAWETECAVRLREMEVLAPKVRQGATGSDQQIYYAEFDHIEDKPEEHR
jgi:replicative DNA helicase